MTDSIPAPTQTAKGTEVTPRSEARDAITEWFKEGRVESLGGGSLWATSDQANRVARGVLHALDNAGLRIVKT